MDAVEKVKRLKDKEEEIVCNLRHLIFDYAYGMKKMTKYNNIVLPSLTKRLDIRLKIIHKKLDDIYEIINLANEL